MFSTVLVTAINWYSKLTAGKLRSTWMRWNLLTCHLQQRFSFPRNQIPAKTDVFNEHMMGEPRPSPPWSSCSLLCHPKCFSAAPHSRNLQQLLCCPLNQQQLKTHLSILLRQDHGMCNFFLPEFAQLSRFHTDACLWRNASCETRFWQKPASLLASSPSGTR